MSGDVLVTHEYVAQADDELTLKIGEVIREVVKASDGWCEGNLNGRRGMFPDNFVKQYVEDKAPVTEKTAVARRPNAGGVSELRSKLGSIIGGPPPPGIANRGLRKPNKLAKVTNHYDAERDDELTLEVGDIVEVLKTDVEDGWWEGRINGKSGAFPNNFVQLIETVDGEEKISDTGVASSEIKGRKVAGVGFGNIFAGAPIVLRKTAEKRAEPVDAPASASAGGGEVKSGEVSKASVRKPATKLDYPKAKVLFAYEAQNDDELTLTEGQVISVLDQELEDKGWWKGELNGAFGVFPDNFVELIPVTNDVDPAKMKKPLMPPNTKPTKTEPVQSKAADQQPKAAVPLAQVKKEEVKVTAAAKPVAEKKVVKLGVEAKQSFELPDKPNSPPTVAKARPPGRPAPPDDVRNPASPPTRPVFGVSRVDSREVLGGPKAALSNDSIAKVAGGAVSMEQFLDLQKEVSELREAVDQTRKAQEKRFHELMGEIDEEKKTRLSLQVEIDRLKKFVNSD